jgi:hypothetical protein
MKELTRIHELIFGEDGYVEDISDPSDELWLKKLQSTKFDVYEWEMIAFNESIPKNYKYPNLFSLINIGENVYIKKRVAGYRLQFYRSLIDYECFTALRELFNGIKQNKKVDVEKTLVLIRYYLFETKLLDIKYTDHFLYACYGETSDWIVKLDIFDYDNEVPACNYLVNTYMRFALTNLHDTIIRISGCNYTNTNKDNTLSELLTSKITNEQYAYIILSILKVEETLASSNTRKIETVYMHLKNLFYEHSLEKTRMHNEIMVYIVKCENTLFVKKLISQNKEWKKRENDEVDWHLSVEDNSQEKIQSFLGKRIKIDGLSEQEIVKLIWKKANTLKLSGENLLRVLPLLTFNAYLPFLDFIDLKNLDDTQVSDKLINEIVMIKAKFNTKNEKLYCLHIYLSGIAEILKDRDITDVTYLPSFPRLIQARLADLYELEKNSTDEMIDEMERGKIKPINVNMSVSDLALLFRALHHVDAIDTSSKKQLFSSASQMFTTSAKDGQKISEHSFKNNFNEPNLNSHQYWRVKLKKMLDFITEYK